jgi:hypothetical protein
MHLDVHVNNNLVHIYDEQGAYSSSGIYSWMIMYISTVVRYIHGMIMLNVHE